MKINSFLLASLLASATALSGCVVIPESEEEPYPPQRIATIELELTDRREILAEFGSPRHSTDDNRIIAYSEEQVHATAYVLVGGPYQGYIIPIPIFTRHNLVIWFSSEDTVEKVEQMTGSMLGHYFSESESFSAEGNPLAMRKQTQIRRHAIEDNNKKRRADLLPKAEAGDSIAQYEIASSYFEDQEERWYWFCRASHGGHPDAMMMMAAKSITIREKATEQDQALALHWFLLAEKAGSVQAGGAANQLINLMPQEKVSEVRKKLDKWVPDPSLCDTAEDPDVN